MSKKLKIALAISFSIVFFYSFIIDKEANKKHYAETITAADLKTHLSIIASDAYEGRETGKKGQHMTAEYLAAQFKSYGIPELSIGGYFQNVPLVLLLAGGGIIKTANQTFSFGNDFYYTSSVDEQQVKTEKIVFKKGDHLISFFLFLEFSKRAVNIDNKTAAFSIFKAELNSTHPRNLFAEI